MEYFIGSFVTFLGAAFLYILLNNIIQMPSKSTYRYSQSHIHSLIKPLMPPTASLKKPLHTQSSKHLEEVQIKVIIVGPDAYWIKDNTLYTAKITKDGVDKETTFPVDTMGMDKVELDKTIFIVDQLQNGQKRDSGSTGNE